MAVVINTNVYSLRIQNILSSATTKMSSSMQRMSTGLKINQAKDDAAGTVISARMQVQLNGNKIAQNNVQNANAMLATAEGNLDVVEENVSRIRDLTLQAKNGTYSDKEKEAMQAEVAERIAEIDRVSDSAKYSQLSLFEDSNLQTNGVTFQVGANGDEHNTITADKAIFESVKFSVVTGGRSYLDLTALDSAGFEQAITDLDTAIDNITARKSTIGSVENRLESALDTLTTQFENLSSAKSIITDADIAAEASNFTQQQILQQVSTSLLSQANQAPSIALSLI
jgi:flagellin